MGIDCRYCHTTVEESSFANIPATKVCMNCHSEMWAVAPILEPVRESYRSGKSIEWTRVHDLPQFVYFNHSIHVNKGIGCETCHGRVDRMPLMWQAQDLTMSWCLNCHRDPGMFVRPKEKVFEMGYTPPPNQREFGEKTRKGIPHSKPDQLLDVPSMKTEQTRDLVPVETLTDAAARKRYWRSLEELSDSPEFQELLHTEFPPNATEFIDEVSRRRFLQLAAASLGLAGLTACTRQPPEKILPYVNPPENAIPGHPLYFATAVPVAGVAEGVLVETHLGRPTKIEGNSEHPASLGATSVHSQASVLELYDPDRAKEISHLGVWQSWEDFQLALMHSLTPLRSGNGERFRILTDTVTSPTLGAQIQAVLAAFPGAKWYQYDPAGRHSARAGALMAFGRDVNSYYQFEKADVVLALDSDFLACGQASTRFAHDFASRRAGRDRSNMNRLYSIESSMTSTGGKADHRLPLRYAEIELFARDLAAALGVPGLTASGSQIHPDWISAISRDLMAHRGACVVVPGLHQSPAVHAMAHAMNSALGNAGKTVIYTDPLEVQSTDQIASLRELVNDMDAGNVDVLLILGGNPVYNAPQDFDFRSRLRRVKDHISRQPALRRDFGGVPVASTRNALP